MWYEQSVFYQIYPLGFCGAPPQNDGVPQNRLQKIGAWIPHMKKLNIDALYLGPVFDSDAHGYDTRDYRQVDCRLGGGADLAALCEQLHGAGIRVIFDGVFHHVGRGFWAFQDVLRNREASPYKDWFHINFGGNNGYGDGLWYEGWEGHFELVKLNLQNPAVVDHLLDCVRGWAEDYGIDGLRLDVAYSLDQGFLRRLRSFAKAIRPDFFLLGECLHGDYNRFVNGEMLDSCTNYECYKGLYSSFNEKNLFEIGYSLNRQFGPEQWTLYKGKPLFSFLDNHDVSRIASILKQQSHLLPAWGLLFGMPGIPCVYCGSEWGTEGRKEQGDAALRPSPDAPVENELSRYIAHLAGVRRESRALQSGSYRPLLVTNEQLVFERLYEGERVVVAINAADSAFDAGGRLSLPPGRDALEDGREADDWILPPCSAVYRILDL